MGLFGGKKPEPHRARVKREKLGPAPAELQEVEEYQPGPIYLNAEREFRGVVLHGCETPGWIQNRNAFPVLVVPTIPLLNGNKIIGERRVTSFLLKPGERSERARIPRLAQYQIWNESGGYLGFLQAIPNGKPT